LTPPAELAPGGDRALPTLADRVENGVSIALLVGMAVLPILEIVGRRVWRTGVPGSGSLVQHATLWIGLLGGAIAARTTGSFRSGISRTGSGSRTGGPVRLRRGGLRRDLPPARGSGLQLVRAEWADTHFIVPFLPFGSRKA